jgi:hypothetical protein
MNCEDFESNVNDLAREQVMDASVHAMALAHRDECETCARRLEDERALSLKLQALATDTRAVPAPALGKELLAALRERQRATIPPVAAAAWSNSAMFAGVMAVAAVILLVIAVSLIRSPSLTPAAQNPPSLPGLPNSRNETAKATEVISGSQSAPQSAPLPNKKSDFAEHRVGRKNTRRNLSRIVEASQAVAKSEITTTEPTTVAANDPVEITTDFMPVGYASAANLQDGGQLVRVELPRSALVAFGLPMNFNRYDEKVKADVFFGSDGMARAIRFVQ